METVEDVTDWVSLKLEGYAGGLGAVELEGGVHNNFFLNSDFALFLGLKMSSG